MIARVRFLLPFSYSIPEGVTLKPFQLAGTSVGETIEVLPPYNSAPEPLDEIGRSFLEPAASQVSDQVTIDGTRTTQANTLQLNLHKATFSRQKPHSPQELSYSSGDPSGSSLLELANRVLTAMRTVTRSWFARPLSEDRPHFFRIDYLDDNGDRLPSEAAQFRSIQFVKGRFGVSALTEPGWDLVASNLSGTEAVAHGWDVLLLDAEAALPEIGVALVLAFAALETFIAWALDQLRESTGKIDPDLWRWINKRESYHQQPSVKESFDALLKILGGQSLKEEKRDLWERFAHLNTGRNRFVHKGTLTYGDPPQPIDQDKAAELVQAASDIISWTETLLPSVLQRRISNYRARASVVPEGFPERTTE